ncbi:MAG: GntR family transcriptional regulator [Candidatus Humimicrobiaceae bacterium]
MINLKEFIIEKKSPIPLYYQIEKFIINKIQNGDLKTGEKIPTEKDFMEILDISRITIRKAIDNLVKNNYLEIKRSKGTFVKNRLFLEPLNYSIRSFSDEALKAGYIPSIKILIFKLIEPSKEIAENLQLSETNMVYEFKRLRLLNEEPSGIDINYIPANLVPGFSINDFKEKGKEQSLLYILEKKYNLVLSHGIETITATLTNKLDSELLNIKNRSPIALRQRIIFLNNNKPIIYMRSVYKIGFQMNLVGRVNND